MIRWGIVGPGGIARDFRNGASQSLTGKIVALGSRGGSTPQLEGDFPGVRIHAGYDALLDDAGVDAIYISTPHAFHARWAIRAAQKGKHVLCEKPLAMNAREADNVFTAARAAGTFTGEAFMYRLHPVTAKLAQLVSDGIVGEVRMIRSSFGFAWLDPPAGHRLFDKVLGGGSILDVGCYPVSMCRLLAKAAAGDPGIEPVALAGEATMGPTGVDEWAAAQLRYANGLIAQVGCSISVQQDNVLHVMGTTGRLELADFWFAGGKQGGIATIRVHRYGQAPTEVTVSEGRNLYSFQFEAANAAIREGRCEFAAPGMSWADSLGNALVLDQWLAAAGICYE